MDKDDVIAFLVENGLLSVRWQQPLTARDLKPTLPPHTASTIPEPIIKFRKGLISESELCTELGIQEKELFRYLVDNGLLFDFN